MKKFVYLFSIIFLALLFIGCKDHEDRLYLSNFEYSINGRNGRFQPIDNNSLSHLNNLPPKHTGHIWLRTRFESPEFSGNGLVVYLGSVKIANECYINGNYIGKFGSFPPYVFSSGENITYYDIPPALLKPIGDENFLEIHIWVDSQGRMIDNPFVGTPTDVHAQVTKDNFVGSKVIFVASFIMMIVASVYFFLYILRPNEKANISFSRLNFFSVLYLFSQTINEFPFNFSPQNFTYLTYLKVFSGISGILTGYFAVSFIRDYLGAKDLPRQKIHRLSITLIPCIALLFPKTMHNFFIVLAISYIVLGIHILYAVKILLIEFKKRNRKVYSLLLGFSPVLISLLIVGIICLLGYPFYKIPVVLGWQATVFVFLCILFTSFAKMENEVEFLNNNLEKIVKDRTNELQCTNKLLEETNTHLAFEKKRSERELALASFVQQSFYKNTIPVLKDWDIGYYFKPLDGVSGDLYDFFGDDNSLDGFGIFDVSGHGIASGLVTMLVKNIIHQEFYIGESLPLIDVMDIINNRVTEEKGNIENYLTGILARVHENHRIEFVNAGHPYPILYTAKTDSAKSVEETNPNRCGVIGIPDLQMDFSLNTIHLHTGDALLLYTDGIIEAENEAGEPFGMNRLINIFQKTQNLSIAEQNEQILSEIKNFINSDIIEDDITILIIRRK